MAGQSAAEPVLFTLTPGAHSWVLWTPCCNDGHPNGWKHHLISEVQVREGKHAQWGEGGTLTLPFDT